MFGNVCVLCVIVCVMLYVLLLCIVVCIRVCDVSVFVWWFVFYCGVRWFVVACVCLLVCVLCLFNVFVCLASKRVEWWCMVCLVYSCLCLRGCC